MACSNHPSEKDIEEIEQEANRRAEDVRQEVHTIQASVRRVAEQCAKEVEEYARLQVQLAQHSGKPLSTSDVAAIKSRIDQFAKEKAEEVRQYERLQPKFETKTGRIQKDRVSDFNPNPDAGTIPGFHSGLYETSTGFGIVMKDDNEPGRSTHIHYHKDGITLTTCNARTGSVDRFNLVTGRSETREGEDTEWPRD